MNRYPLWKNLLVLLVVLTAGFYALPNLFGDDPAVQISAERMSEVDLDTVSEVEDLLTDAELDYKAVSLEDEQILVRFDDENTQQKARDVLLEALDGDYIVALNLAPTTPQWMSKLNAQKMNLGLDLRGGVHFLMEVDMTTVMENTLEGYADDIRVLLREERVRYTGVEVEDGELSFRFRNSDDRDTADTLIGREIQEIDIEAGDGEEPSLVMKINEETVNETRSLALQQNITTLRNRINELGVAEPTVQQQGQSRIVVQLPGVQDTAQAKKILGATATLEFRLVDTDNDARDAVDGRVPANSELYHHRDGQPYLLNKRVMLTGEHIINANSTLDGETGSPTVSVTLDGQGARIFSDITRDNIGNPMAVVFIESQTETRENAEGETETVRKQVPEIINVATIRDQLSKKFQITGLDDTSEARDLALLLRAGALAAPIDIVEERTVGPSMGQENIDQGFMSVMIGFALVLIFMAVWYRVFGLVANLALAMNLVLLVSLLSLLQATLTMPGIAGIVLTVGMAVDANVLIFERIREELRLGNSPQASINAGYGKAFSTIADANITTLIAAVVLFGFGTGTIKGFAVTLSLGILTSMFTAIMGTRAVVNLIYGRKHRPKLAI